ncbi:DUF2933 domain-containing protein [Natroniella sp. ANB-PHB2]|uniref:DUF2933 domain-containing protein n=1 Tax=Natroniella sp. ANB-PHB2 TaxID=3384444 RepID=UPI0038D3EAF0
MSNKKGHQYGGNHLWMMLLCCIAMFAGIWWFAGSGVEVGRDGFAGGNFRWLIFLLCPLMHLFMMKGMCHKDKGEEQEDKDCH